jgi:CubicO group peptidase (beta-lactamase class C family)
MMFLEESLMDIVDDHVWLESKEFIERALKKKGVPGCSVGILHQGEMKAAGFGVSNVENNHPVSAETLFQIGSISKTFTATVAMKLVEEGRLDLHLPVRSYLPDFRVADESVSSEVTPYHLLTHTEGWDGDLFLETGDGEDAIPKYIQRLSNREQISPLGQYFSYNNSGFAVLGGILEAITDKRIEELYKADILEPLGLVQTCFNASEVITYDFSVGHHPSPDGNSMSRPWRMPRNSLPMGGIITNVGDLLRYAQCYLAKGKAPSGKQMLKAETIDEMFAPKMLISQEDRTSVGYSWMRRDLNQGYLMQHSGGTNGQVTQLSLLPEQNFALAIFTNSDLGDTLIKDVQQFLLKTYLDIEYELPKELESTPEQLANYSGTASKPASEIHFDMLGDYLVGLSVDTYGFPTENDPIPPPPPPFRIGRCGEDRLLVLDGYGKDSPIDVFRDPEGKINYLRAGRLYRFSPKNN